MLQFGEPKSGLTYVERPAAFGIAGRDGKVALVEVVRDGGRHWDLPGGAIDPGEDEAKALVREFGEETGLKVSLGRRVVNVAQRFLKDPKTPVNNRGGVYEVIVDGEDAALKIEDDHTLVWLDPGEALTCLRHEAHAVALLFWMRARAA
ncbi:NUDIX domain-containing protein [Caulobacter segnis]|uniref:NUDIX domain-containing protein n=1 Tax=Caulobacter segnis TaxID=88688 RepID=UPI0024109CE6|nr:NUDIX domain-containing protein [Caulobacter segnis]MDG2522544.1 NUDIX domain-containing protein [Caulobacter segnis]